MSVELHDGAAARLFDSEAQLEKLFSGLHWAEGPVWNFTLGRLTFSDVVGDTIYACTQDGAVSVYRRPSSFANGQTIDLQGKLVNCEHRGRRLARETADGVQTVVDRYEGRRLNSPNDVAAARDGSLYFTDPTFGLFKPEEGGDGTREIPFCGVYRVAPGSTAPLLLVDDMPGPNGLALSPEETLLYVGDTRVGAIRRFAVRPDGTVRDDGTFVQVPTDDRGFIDGMKVDMEGNVYVAGSGGLWVFSPAGTTLAQIQMPEICANLAWGDSDARTLYITATTSLYRLRLRAQGYAPHRTGL